MKMFAVRVCVCVFGAESQPRMDFSHGKSSGRLPVRRPRIGFSTADIMARSGLGLKVCEPSHA